MICEPLHGGAYPEWLRGQALGSHSNLADAKVLIPAQWGEIRSSTDRVQGPLKIQLPN